jgi:hypothetical protein
MHHQALMELAKTMPLVVINANGCAAHCHDEIHKKLSGRGLSA